MGYRVLTDRLKHLREENGHSQRSLAAAAGVGKRTLERLEQGESSNLSTIQKVARALGVRIEELVAPEKPDEDPVTIARAPFADYFKAIIQVFGSAHFLGLAHRVDEQNMPIEKLFVEPELCERYIDPDMPVAQWPERRKLLEALAALAANPHMVVLGNAGSGKSTIVSMIACQLAAERKNPWRHALKDAIPVPIVLRELVLPAKYSFDELLEALQQTELGRCLSRRDMQLVIDAVHEGRAILLLDGIDELSDVARREALHKAVWDGMARYQGCRLVMTSRITGHEAVPFQLGPAARAAEKRREQRAREDAKPAKPRGAEIVDGVFVMKMGLELGHELTEPPLPLHYVAPFDDTRIESFALNWYRQREESERRAKEKAGNLAEAVRRDEGTNTLARIPNLLTLMALLHRLEADLPHGKARLYAKIVETYLETIDNYRKLTERPDSLLDKKRWLARVAFAMQKRRSKQVEPEIQVGPVKSHQPAAQEEPQREILIERTDLQQLIRAGMAKAGKKSADDGDIRAFIDHIQRRSGLLIERGADLFAFTHLSFQEYFAAWHMSLYDPRDDEYREFTPYVADSAWLETFCFFFEIVADERQVKKDDIRQALLGAGWEKGEPLPRDKENDALLLARLAIDRYSGLPDELARQAVTSSLRWALAKQEKNIFPGPLVLRVLLAGHENAAAVLAELVRLAVEQKLTQLNLAGTAVRDLEPLAALTQLQWLGLDRTAVRDLEPLAALTQLQWLGLDGTAVRDLQPLAALTQLQWLGLDGTAVRDLQPLAALTQLQELELRGTAVRDLQPLAALTQLQGLDLRGTAVRDLEPLAALTQLRGLDLDGTAVSKEEVAALKAALPELRIFGP